jgi:hypothetical protein
VITRVIINFSESIDLERVEYENIDLYIDYNTVNFLIDYEIYKEIDLELTIRNHESHLFSSLNIELTHINFNSWKICKLSNYAIY